MVDRVKLKSKTFSKKCKSEIKNLTQDVVGYKKVHVPAIGYVWYLKNIDEKTIGQVYKFNGELILEVK